jgi:hypothetical protein
MATGTEIDVHDLTIDTTLVRAAMRDELVIFYNKFAYWSEQHSTWDARKKLYENMLEEAKDKAKAIRAREADEKEMKAKIQEAYIRDFWDVPISVINTDTGEISETTCSSLLAKYSKASQQESIMRHKMNVCSTALDIGRTCVSWDKTEMDKMGGAA